jgi:hypothetical protein
MKGTGFEKRSDPAGMLEQVEEFRADRDTNAL